MLVKEEKKYVNEQTKDPDKSPHKYRQLIFDKRIKAMQESKDNFSINGAETTGYANVK
jgi:hypothetical protein